ncbi:hypothetical protein [Selenomonas ruminantium]|uniref:Uncharacterized protein n=1 Tax=Selenomonas ruminantium TaxID=971 RepID=A0A1K1PJQ4_SELRU|nr:hypothetical protein [Selenomonas ruminantium]SFW48024.1 hypothetical protein SAMN02910323_2055 [Selenomonas ruminantium]
MDNHEKFNCPHCGSDNTALIPLVYKRGHATGTAVHREVVGYDVETTTATYSNGQSETYETGRTPIYGDVKHGTYTITDLAAEIAPPNEPIKPIRDTKRSFVSELGVLFMLYVAYLVTKLISPVFSLGEDLISLIIKFTIWGIVWLVLVHFFDKIWDIVSGKNAKYEKLLQKYEEDLYNYQQECIAWEKSYICMRCGHRFYVE